MLGDLGTREAVDKRSAEAGVGEVRSTQVLRFDISYGNTDIRLIELHPELLATLTKEKQFVLRGDGTEDAVLCTTNKTYTLKEVTTSNSLLLSPDLSNDTTTTSTSLAARHVVSTNFQYYELKLCRAKLDKMRAILSLSSFRGEEYEEENLENRVKFGDLLDRVQASEEELRAGLDEVGAVELNGQWRVIEQEYKTSAMSRILTLLEEKGWSWERVPLIESCHTLADLQPRFVTEMCLRMYGNQVDETQEEVYIKLFEDRISRFYGEYILSSTAGKFNLSEFEAVWQDSLPDGMCINLVHLRGLAMVIRDTKPNTISYLPLSSLPVDPGQRFAALFLRREKWAHGDLIPYLEDLVGPGQTVNSLLLKHCRSSTDHVTKMKIYNSKIRS